MSCDARFANADEYNKLMCAGLDLTDPDQVAQVEFYLDLAAADIHAAMSASGQCDCSLSTWANSYLKKLNILDAAVIQSCPCSNMTDERKQSFIDWLNGQYELIRTSKIELCSGETGADFPAFADVERSWTELNAAQIIANTMAKQP